MRGLTLHPKAHGITQSLRRLGRLTPIKPPALPEAPDFIEMMEA
jgi:hypothetical protein